MGKKNSKLSQDVVKQLTRDTYCEYSNLPHVSHILYNMRSIVHEKIQYSISCWKIKK